MSFYWFNQIITMYVLDLRNLQEQVKKASCFKNCTELSLFEWIGLVVWKMFVILGLSTSKVYPWSLEHFFLRKVRTILEFWNTVRFFDCGFFSVLKVGKLFCLTLRIIFLTAKGQIISKSFLDGRGFSLKTNENTSNTSKNEFICSFFGRIHGLTNCFWN